MTDRAGPQLPAGRGRDLVRARRKLLPTDLEATERKFEFSPQLPDWQEKGPNLVFSARRHVPVRDVDRQMTPSSDVRPMSGQRC